VLLLDGAPPTSLDDWGRGARIDTSALAAVLRAIADGGAAAFADPSLAEHVERAVAAAGGILTAADLASYTPRVVFERPTRYGRYAVATGEDDCGHELFGLLDRLGMCERAHLSADRLHLLAEAFGHVLSDVLTWAGDPEAAPDVSAALRSDAFVEARAAAIDPMRAARRPIRAGAVDGLADPGAGVGGTSGTTQVAALDAEGNAAVAITTIGRDFGSLVHVPELGLFLNTAMANFDPRPGRTNSIAPGRMPLFGVPAVVAIDGEDAVLACGGSGGYRITSGVVHATVAVLDHDLSAAEAVSAPRVWCQGEQTYVDRRVPAGVRAELAARGHDLVVEELTPAYEPFARVSLVRRHADGTLEAASDPFWHGAAGAL
jgi:gamma-glutamyltranspeptidase/glutathione hydrolase